MGAPTHFLIKLVGISKVTTKKAAEFLFSQEHDCLIYRGEPLPIEQHNEIVPAVMERYKDYLPRLPQVVLLTLAPASKKPAPAPAPEPAPVPVSTEPEPTGSGGVPGEQSGQADTDAAGEGTSAPAAEVPAPKKKKAK